MSALRIGVILLTLATAIIHLQLNFPDPAFILNGLVYLGLLGLLCLPIPQLANYQSKVRWALIGFAALTIFLWVLLGRPYTPIGYIDKIIELALISLLLIEARSSGSPTSHRRATRR